MIRGASAADNQRVAIYGWRAVWNDATHTHQAATHTHCREKATSLCMCLLQMCFFYNVYVLLQSASVVAAVSNRSNSLERRAKHSAAHRRRHLGDKAWETRHSAAHRGRHLGEILGKFHVDQQQTATTTNHEHQSTDGARGLQRRSALSV